MSSPVVSKEKSGIAESPTSETVRWWKKSWGRSLILAGVVITGAYAIVYVDVVSRAKSSFGEAEKYMEWYRFPDKKKEFFEAKFQKEKAGLDRDLSARKLSEDDYKQKLDAIQFDRDFALQESSLKYAYQWYKDTYELFSPPESKWVRLARERAPEALRLWKQELREKKIPFDDTMVE